MGEPFNTCLYHRIAMLPGSWPAPDLDRPGRWKQVYGRSCPIVGCGYHTANGREREINESEQAERKLPDWSHLSKPNPPRRR